MHGAHASQDTMQTAGTAACCRACLAGPASAVTSCGALGPATGVTSCQALGPATHLQVLLEQVPGQVLHGWVDAHHD